MADRYSARLKEKHTLISGIKDDIKEMLAEKGYGDCGGFAEFMLTSKPDRFKSVGIDFGNLYFKDNKGTDWHSDNVNDIEELLTILRAVHHILPR